MSFKPGIYSISLKAEGLSYDVDLSLAPDSMVHALLRQGIAILFQRCTARGAEAKMTPAEKLAAYSALLKELNEGKWEPGSVGGGAKLSEEEKEFRTLLIAAFVEGGVKKSDAAKYVTDKDRLAYYRDTVLLPAIRRIDPAKATNERGTALANKHFDVLSARAVEIVKARAQEVPGMALDLDD